MNITNYILIFMYLFWHTNFAQSITFVQAKAPDCSLSATFLEKFHTNYKIKNFVETGTRYGGTSARAAQIFNTVQTVELSPSLFEQAKNRLSKFKNVVCNLGASEKWMPIAIKNLDGAPTLFFLDAHYSGGETAKGSTNTPIREELKSISSYNEPIVLIDDLRIFQPYATIKLALSETAGNPVLIGYPSIKELTTNIKTLFPNHEFICFGDIGLISPLKLSNTISPLLRALTASRCFDGPDYQKIIDAEMYIASFNRHTKEENEAITQLILGSPGTPYTLSTHYRLWDGLCCIGFGEYTKAIDLFHNALSFGFDDWRLKYYLGVAYYGAKNFPTSNKFLEQISEKTKQFSLPTPAEFILKVQKINRNEKSQCHAKTHCSP